MPLIVVLRGAHAMDVEKVHAYIQSLADGVDPLTGWVLPADHTCQQPDLIRALAAAARLIERDVRREQRLKRARLTLPANTGRSWTVEEDGALLKRFRAGASVEEIANLHGRTHGAIRARLEKLGQLVPGAPAGQGNLPEPRRYS